MARGTTVAVLVVVVVACGGSGESAPTTLPPSTTPPTTLSVPTTTAAPVTTTTVALDCAAFGQAMTGVAQSFLYQTFDGGAAFERQQGEALAASLEVVGATIAALREQIGALGEPPAGFENAITLMLEAIDLDEDGYSSAADAARAGDQIALDTAVATIDLGFQTLMSANVALAAAQECSG
ncbi:MAG TPA: hypothetical protein VK960_07960 [Acidimicrobiia bacterium]|nr:hypothetical protein [Acidimicrobiia bacterium]